MTCKTNSEWESQFVTSSCLFLGPTNDRARRHSASRVRDAPSQAVTLTRVDSPGGTESFRGKRLSFGETAWNEEKGVALSMKLSPKVRFSRLVPKMCPN